MFVSRSSWATTDDDVERSVAAMDQNREMGASGLNEVTATLDTDHPQPSNSWRSDSSHDLKEFASLRQTLGEFQ